MMRPILLHWGMGVSAIVASVAITVIYPLIGSGIIDVALKNSNGTAFLALLGFLVIAMAMSFVMNWIGSYFMVVCREYLVSVLQKDALNRFWASSKLNTQVLSFEDANGLSGFLTLTLSKAFGAFFELFLIFAVLLALRLSVFLTGALALLLLVPLAIRSSRKLVALGGNESKRSTNLLMRLHEMIGSRAEIGLRRLKALGERVLAREQYKVSQTRLSYFAWDTWYGTGQMLWSIVFSTFVAIVSGFSVFRGELSIGEYIAIQIYVSRIDHPVMTLISVVKDARAFATPARHLVSSQPSGVRIEGLELMSLDPGARILVIGSALEGWNEFISQLHGVSPAVLVSAEPTFFYGSMLENLCLDSVSLSGARDQSELDVKVDTLLKKLRLPARLWINPSRFEVQESLRQRVQLARAMLLGPKLLIVEDFTERLGPGDQKICFEALEQFSGAIVFIRAKGPMVSFVRQVYELANGRLLSKGSVEQFLNSDSLSRPLLGPWEDSIVSKRVLKQLQSWDDMATSSTNVGKTLVGPRVYSEIFSGFGQAHILADVVEDLAQGLRSCLEGQALVLVSAGHNLTCQFSSRLEPRLIDPLMAERRVACCLSKLILTGKFEHVYFKTQSNAGSLSEGLNL